MAASSSHLILSPMLILFTLTSLAGTAAGITIEPGFDLFTTDPAYTYRDFSDDPIPADFFGPGSDPFDGIIALRGLPLETSPLCPLDDLSQVDTIVERPLPAELPGSGSSDLIPIEIVELQLVSIEPITVTYFGGLEPNLWDVEVSLSIYEQSTGEMEILCGDPCPGGTMQVHAQFCLRLTFIEQQTSQVCVLDQGEAGTCEQVVSIDVLWDTASPPPESCTSNFCIHPASVLFLQSPHFQHGLSPVCVEHSIAVCCLPDDTCLLLIEEDCLDIGGEWHEEWAECEPNPCVEPLVIETGFDLFVTDPGSTFRDFAGNPIPPDFFGPGSDPFDGVIGFRGMPLETSPFCPNDDLSLVDTIVERQGDAHLPGPGSTDLIPTEIVELQLVSTEPIIVTYFGGLDPTPWDVTATLSPSIPSPGLMDIACGDPCPGGWFDAGAEYCLELTFHEEGSGMTLTLDLGAAGICDATGAVAIPWVIWYPPPISCTTNICINPMGLTIYSGPHFQHGVWSVCFEPATAVCCLAGGDCLITTPADCVDLDGIWHPEWDTCVPNPCDDAGIAGGLNGPRLTLQCVPDPILSRAELRFHTREDGPADLEIYALDGRLVRRFSREFCGAGLQVFHWDGRDERGRRASPGVYLYRAKADDGQRTGQLIVIR